MKKAILLLPPGNRDRIYGEEQIEALNELVDLTDCCEDVGDLDALRPVLGEAEIICSGWGMMPLDEEFLEAAPRLDAVFYGAGSVRGFVTESFWERDILLTSAWSANAIPVAQTTVALMVMSLKNAFECRRLTREEKSFQKTDRIRGMYGAKIGIIGVGQIGRKVLELLQNYDVELFCHDPYLSEDEAGDLNTTPLTLKELFETCDVVSLHAPNIPSTQNMITGEHFGAMKDGAVFINTARGALIREDEMIAELKTGRIAACLDVTHPEPPPPESPLYEMDNVFLTPHIAGALGEECKRMGDYVVEEVRRYLRGDPPGYPVTRKMMEWMA
ncbi:MAG: hydroxyacid dehydrogenase [Planctomycetota bacterium]